MIGFILLAALDLVHHVYVGYFITYLITFGTYMPELLMPLWMGSNITNASTRVVALGLFIGRVLSSAVFRDEYAPVYRPALITVAICQGLLLVFLVVMRQYYANLNTQESSPRGRGSFQRHVE
jgi:hypothetical protein